jgi:hypothetical protein
MSERQQGGPGSSGSSDVETGKPQDSRQQRSPGEGRASSDSQQLQQGGSSGNQYGEGNYAASRDYNERTKQFVESGRVEQAAKDAAPKNEREAKEMKEAEREGRRPMREEDPEINPDKDKKMPGRGPDTGQ